MVVLFLYTAKVIINANQGVRLIYIVIVANDLDRNYYLTPFVKIVMPMCALFGHDD